MLTDTTHDGTEPVNIIYYVSCVVANSASGSYTSDLGGETAVNIVIMHLTVHEYVKKNTVALFRYEGETV